MSGWKILPSCLAVVVALVAGNARADYPQVTNVSARQRADKKVEVSYDLSSAPENGVTVSIRFSSDGGARYSIVPETGTLSGDVGSGICLPFGVPHQE